jgi:hypothetical protein
MPFMRDKSITRPSSQSSEAGDVVACTAHGDEQFFLASELHRLNHIGRPSAAGNERRMPVNRGIEHDARGVVPRGRQVSAPRRGKRV